ncbi:conserved hypothetical protein [Ricinus communis]|uniref:Uncharacterized protein n=1 Tax=Ricinus communis TaxID=3988 RepID=B9RD78_RICCO|nr:conserved hypothetical protein [Ricinus communis]
MGIIRKSFSFMLGTLCGVYIAQNYHIPDIRKLARSGLVMARQIEQTHRRPLPDDSNNHDVFESE